MNRQLANDHPTDEWLLIWHESPADLPAPLAREIGAHVPGCLACATRLAGFAALEADLAAWQVARPAPPPMFAAHVLASLPPDLYPRATWSLHAWAQQQIAAVAFLLAGLAALLLASDAWALAGQWWQDAGLWFSNASLSDSASLSAWLGSLPAGALESHLGLLPGALLLGIGACLVLIGNLRPAPVERWRPAHA